jgi:predicted dehydrogenase
MERRSFVKQAAALGLAGLARAQSRERLRAGLIGCGGRGTQAVVDTLTGNENVELVAMADVFEDKLEGSLKRLRDPKFLGQRGGDPASMVKRIRVEPDHHFVGFDAYTKLVASDLDIVMLTTPPGYRPIHFEAAIEAGKHVFAEKPVGTDPVGTRRFMAAARKATEKKLTVVGGAQRHHSSDYIETVNKIQNGAIGDLVAAFSWYLSGPVFHAKARDAKWGDMEWQHRNWYSFIWLCGDQLVEQHYHNIDFMNWAFGTHPVKVVASGGIAWRPREELYGNIFDHMSSDFVYPNGVHLMSNCRQYPQGSYRNVSDLLVGTKGKSSGQDMGTRGINPQVQEHINLVKSIRGEGPYLNQGMALAEATMTCIMGRESAYSGQEITWDQIMASQQDLMPQAFGYDLKMEAPELPVPGKYKFT